MKKRTVAIFTGNRAEYGLQYPILKAVKEHPKLDYKLLVSGAHLEENFGKTMGEIINDGFTIDAEIKIDMDASSLFATANAIGSGIISISGSLEKLQPNIMVVYADRFEGLAAVIASTQMGIPTAHIEGGDITEGGALDDSVRHAMTKLSHIHFTTNQQASNRIMAMGEESWRVHTAGFPAIDLISDGNYAKTDEILAKFRLNINAPIILFTQHSVTTEFAKASQQIRPALSAIKELAATGFQCIITYPNNDAGGKQIIDVLLEFKKENVPNVYFTQSLGRYLYHGILALALKKDSKIICMGNSSSGIKETPAFGCPTINIGSRQEGRLRGENVLDTDYDKDEILNAVSRCINNNKFKETCMNTNNPYYVGGAGKKIANVLAEIELGEKIIRKKMSIKGEVKDGWFR